MESWRTIPGKYVVYRATSVFFGHFFLKNLAGTREIQLNDADIQYPWSIENLFVYDGTSPGYAVRIRYGDYTAEVLDEIAGKGMVASDSVPTVWNTANDVVKNTSEAIKGVATGKAFDEPSKAIQLIAIAGIIIFLGFKYR